MTINYYKEHFPQIIVATAFYHVLHFASPAISTFFFKENYTKLDKKGKANFDIHVVAMVQCLISIAAIIPLVGDEHLQQDAIRNYTPYAGFVSSITIGYFLWDLYVCLKYFDLFGVGFLIHALASLFVFVQTLRPFCLGWVASFLSFELSGPFVNTNWFINKLPAGTVPSWFQIANGLLLILVFFFVRIIWGFYAIYLVSIEFLAVDDYPKYMLAMIVFLNFSLDTLNVYWFSKMIQIAVKTFKGKEKKKD